MSKPHNSPTSGSRAVQSERAWQRMNDMSSALPAPNFLGSADHGYSTPSSHLPSLTHLNETRIMADHPVHEEYSHNTNQYAPPATNVRDEAGRPRAGSQAIPIAALLTNPSGDKETRPARSDSIMQPGGYRSLGPHHGLDRPGPSSSYAPSSAAQSPISQYGSAFPFSAPPPYQFSEPRRPQPMVPPIFTAPHGPSQPHHSYHRRQHSAAQSPTSGSSDSPRQYPEDSRSAVSEVYTHQYTFPPQRESHTPQLEYTLVMRQQPKAARACGFGERDRRVVDPPPIVEVKALNPETGENILVRDSYTTLHCMLMNATTGADASQMSISRGEASSAQRLMGCAVTSPWVGNDETGKQGAFFVFADLSVRSSGKYRLLFRLLKVDPSDIGRRNKNFILASVESDPFEVFTAKEFPGMRASSALLRALRSQGLNVGVKKGSETSRRKDAEGDEDEERDSESGEGEEGDESSDEEEKGGKKKGKAPAKRKRRH